MNLDIYYSKIETIFILTIHRYKELVSRFIDDILNMITNMDQFLISIE
jgi:phosphopantetheine adenylyltransferase